MNGNYPIRKGKCGEEQKKRFYTVHELSPPFAAFAPFCFSPPGAFLSPPRAKFWPILPTLRNTVLDTSTSSDTDNDRDASSTCLTDSFLAVCSHNQSDEALAMSIKCREVPFRLAFTNCRCKRFYARRTYGTINSLRYCSSFYS